MFNILVPHLKSINNLDPNTIMKFFSDKDMNNFSATQSDLSDKNRNFAYVAMFLVAILWGLSWPYAGQFYIAFSENY